MDLAKPRDSCVMRLQDASFEAPTPMPILSAEPTQFPDGLLTDPEVMETQAGRWWAVYTRAKAEKALARPLLPGRLLLLAAKAPRLAKDIRTSALCYLCFRAMCSCAGDKGDRVTALESNLISRILDVPNQQRLWFDLRRVH